MIRIDRLSKTALAAALAASLCATARAAEPAPVAPAAPEAEPVANCVNLQSIRSTKVIDGRTILFEMNGNRTLVNRLPNNCPGLKFEKRFLYKTSLNQLCSQDIITVLTSSGRGASCGLGKFEVYVPPEAVGSEPAPGKLEPAE